jgi:hypothetical protein
MKALQMNVAAQTLLALLRARLQNPWLQLYCGACTDQIHIIVKLSTAYGVHVFFGAYLETIHRMFYLEVYTKRVVM